MKEVKCQPIHPFLKTIPRPPIHVECAACVLIAWRGRSVCPCREQRRRRGLRNKDMTERRDRDRHPMRRPCALGLCLGAPIQNVVKSVTQRPRVVLGLAAPHRLLQARAEPSLLARCRTRQGHPASFRYSSVHPAISPRLYIRAPVRIASSSTSAGWSEK